MLPSTPNHLPIRFAPAFTAAPPSSLAASQLLQSRHAVLGGRCASFARSRVARRGRTATRLPASTRPAAPTKPATTTTTTTTMQDRPPPQRKPSNDKLHQQQQQLQQESQREREVREREETAELDRMAEEWIGSDLSRWEWYERLKSRRARMTRTLAESEAQLDHDVRRLHRTLLEVDSVFGTDLMEPSGAKISPAGWALLVAIMLMYVGVGYAAVHYLVVMMTSTSDTLGFLGSNVCFPV